MRGPKSKSLYNWLYLTEIFLIHNEEWCITKQWKLLCIVCIHKELLIKNAFLVTTCYLFNLVLYCSAVLFLSSFFSEAHYSSLWTIWPEIYSEHLISVLAIPWGKALMFMFMTDQQSLSCHLFMNISYLLHTKDAIRRFTAVMLQGNKGVALD